MRIRQVKPAFWNDRKLIPLSRDARLFYIGLWMEADDSGWLRWDPEQIVIDMFPTQRVTPEMVAGWMDELVAARRMRTLKCGHAFVERLTDHQRMAAPDKRVYTILREHERCNVRKSRSTPRVPAFPRVSPSRSGQVRSGQVRSIAYACEECGRLDVIRDGKVRPHYRMQDLPFNKWRKDRCPGGGRGAIHEIWEDSKMPTTDREEAITANRSILNDHSAYPAARRAAYRTLERLGLTTPGDAQLMERLERIS